MARGWIRDLTSASRVEDHGAGGGSVPIFFAYLSILTIDHASVSRRITVPTPNRDTSIQHLGDHSDSSIYYIESVCLLSSPRPVSQSAVNIYLLG